MTTSAGVAGTDQERKAPGRPRDARAAEAIIDAVLGLLTSGQSVDAISIEAVAAKAGVGKATIYRRWPNKEALLVDAVAALKGPLPELPGTSVRDDLLALVSASWSKRSERYSRATTCLLPELARNPELMSVHRGVMEPRREVMRSVLRRGIESGELRADLDVEITLLLLTAPSMAQSALRWVPGVAVDGFPEALVDAVLCGASVRS